MGKMDFLESELGDSVDVMRLIKDAIDPQRLMNPGKVFEFNE
jgi:D-lactate dehydrogenase (cytochrome)